MNIKKTSLIVSLVGLCLAAGYSLDIPLSGSSGGQGGGQKIGYVDMEKIFQVYPETKFAKEDYAKRLKKLREALTKKEEELNSLQERLTVLESTLKGLNINPPPDVDESQSIDESTAAVDAQTQQQQDSGPVLALKQELETKRAELEEDRKRAALELNTFEKQQSQIILGKIYQALQELASEEQVTLVVDKSSILYGSAEIDLTEKLQQRVRGF